MSLTAVVTKWLVPTPSDRRRTPFIVRASESMTTSLDTVGEADVGASTVFFRVSRMSSTS